MDGYIALEQAGQSNRRWFREVTVKRVARSHF